MHRDPLRDLCPRAVIVWRDGAARCSACRLGVFRERAGQPWRHRADTLRAYIDARLRESIAAAWETELDRLLSPAEPTHVDGKPVAEDLEAIAGTALERFDALRRGHHLPPRSPAWPDDLVDAAITTIRTETTDTEEP